jgi:2,3-dihydroxybiphenyl 1,2-dioxygenase
MGVSQLGYIGIASRAPDAWEAIARTIIGTEVRSLDAADPALRLRLDELHHRIAIYPGEKDDVLHAGWMVDSEAELDRLAQELDKAGAQPTAGTAEDAADRRVHKLIRFTDPEGYANDLFVRPLVDAAPLRPSLPIAGFKAGRIGFGHVVRHCKNYRETVAFYQQILGFRSSDHILWADMDATFMRCNPRHHSLALLNESIGHTGGQTNHIMIELASLDDVGRAYDEVLRQRLPIIMTLGRHGNDMTTSFYFVGPSGFGVEIGCGGMLVDDETWQIKTYNATKIWGHLLPHERPWEAHS